VCRFHNARGRIAGGGVCWVARPCQTISSSRQVHEVADNPRVLFGARASLTLPSSVSRRRTPSPKTTSGRQSADRTLIAVNPGPAGYRRKTVQRPHPHRAEVAPRSFMPHSSSGVVLWSLFDGVSNRGDGHRRQGGSSRNTLEKTLRIIREALRVPKFKDDDLRMVMMAPDLESADADGVGGCYCVVLLNRLQIVSEFLSLCAHIGCAVSLNGYYEAASFGNVHAASTKGLDLPWIVGE